MSQVSTEWIVGWKIAYMYCTNARTLRFAPLHQDGLISAYGVDAVAEYQQRNHHAPPQDGCHCGFNAWHERATIKRFKMNRNTGANSSTVVQLRVGLYGDVIEGTLWQEGAGADVWGYRASQQRIADVFVSSQCYRCQGRATALELTTEDYAFGWCLQPTCGECIAPQSFTTLEELAAKNNVEMHWLDDGS